jgi:hypothetical protein
MWTVEIYTFSTEPGQVGQDTRDVRKTPHATGPEALLDLERAIDTSEGAEPGRMVKYMVRTPDNRLLPLDHAYGEIYGKHPVHRGERESLYPELRKAARALKRKKATQESEAVTV